MVSSLKFNSSLYKVGCFPIEHSPYPTFFPVLILCARQGSNILYAHLGAQLALDAYSALE